MSILNNVIGSLEWVFQCLKALLSMQKKKRQSSDFPDPFQARRLPNVMQSLILCLAIIIRGQKKIRVAMEKTSDLKLPNTVPMWD
jgi:hypothetical protein